MSQHFRTCTLCEAMCGVVIEAEGDRVVSLRGDREDSFSRGHICPKAMGLRDLHEDPDRLRRPMRRDGAKWHEIAWDDAFDLVASRLRAVQDEHGKDAVAVYLGNPTVHNYGSMLFGPMFLRALRTRSRFSATSVDQLPQMLASYWMFGHQLLIPIPDLDRTDYLLILGANPVVSNGSLMTAPDVAKRIAAIRARGGRVVVLDPRRTETAAVADEHHFVRPGSDALFLLGVLYVIFAEGHMRLGRCAEFTTGLEAFRSLVLRFPPERVAASVGIAADVIRAIARGFVTAPSAVCYGRVGACTQEFGALTCWLVNALNIVTGNLDRAGGAMFTAPAVDLVARTGRGHFGRYKSRVRGLPEFSGELPVAVLAEEIETPGKGQLRALVTSAGNPVLSTPNGSRLERALAKLDFMVSVDFYRNETTRFAHVILPPTSVLEHDHYDLVFHMLAIRNTAKYSEALFPPAGGARHDWQIWNELTRRLARGGLAKQALARAQAAVLGRLGPHGLLDLALRTGPRGARALPPRRGLSLRKLRGAPHGIDLGALTPCLPARLRTRDRHVLLTPREALDDTARLEARLAEAEREPSGATEQEKSLELLDLIGRRELRSNNSWMHNSVRLVKGKLRCTLRMHPDDAAARGLVSGALARVRSRVGEVTVPIEISNEMMPGVVSLPHGYGHARPGVGLTVAREHAGVSINDLTDDQAVDALSGNASFSGIRVSVALA
jgi:anaerobic selenocysteine-containing dehydrogenase